MDIDFVILWVDGNDPEWLLEYNKFSQAKNNEKKKVLYRDWNNLHYIFRAFEIFTPWVRKIHFVTWGHLPVWLNTNHPKLNIVKHTDILRPENLPVFNSNAIEPSIYKIEGLSEHFILFNDDFFLTLPISKRRFFQNGLPRDILVSNALSSSTGVGHFVLNNLEILNRHFDKKTVLKKNFGKWFNLAYGKEMMRSLFLLPWPRFTGFVDLHQPQPFLKSTFQEVWEKEKEVLERTSATKFRACSDVNQYLFRYWQLVKGEFVPISMKDTHYEEITIENIDSGKIDTIITSQKYSMVCLNDSEEMNDEKSFKKAKESIKKSFETILPQKSDFEI